MSRDFWMGMFVIPAAALAVAGVAAAVMIGLAAFVYASEKWSLGEWKVWPKRAPYQDTMASIVACAKSTRYLWVPGWHIVICRTTLSGRIPGDRERHYRVKAAVARELCAIQDEEADQ